MIISIIAAMDQNRLIGSDNGLPWHLPADFKHFKEITLGKPVLMGRKTFESIGRPLPGRKNIVISRSGFRSDGVEVVNTIDAGLALVADVEEVMIIGGATIYEQTISRAKKLYITHVEAKFVGDTWFPEISESDWTVIDQKSFEADDKNNYSFKIITYQTKN